MIESGLTTSDPRAARSTAARSRSAPAFVGPGASAAGPSPKARNSSQPHRRARPAAGPRDHRCLGRLLLGRPGRLSACERRAIGPFPATRAARPIRRNMKPSAPGAPATPNRSRSPMIRVSSRPGSCCASSSRWRMTRRSAIVRVRRGIAIPLRHLHDQREPDDAGEILYRAARPRRGVRPADRDKGRAAERLLSRQGYHQDYLTLHPGHPYIVYNDLPKVENLKRLFPALYTDKPRLVGEGKNPS